MNGPRFGSLYRSFTCLVRGMASVTEPAVQAVKETALDDESFRSGDSRKRPHPADNTMRAEIVDLKKIRLGDRQQRPGFSEDRFHETEYYFENGLRKVYPYEFTYSTFVKGRWVGRTLVDVFDKEFRAQTLEYYHRAIATGRVRVNNEKVGLDYVLKDNDLMVNKAHRHEVPVLGCKLKIIHEDDDMLVVDKPPSLPVHPCGRYRHNSVIFLLAKEHNIKKIHTIHRLDRLTSGVLLFAKSLERSQFMSAQIRGLAVHKEYLCRVEGEFPADEVEISQPIETFSNKIGVCGVDPAGKECSTIFKRLSFNGKSSVVLARPKQGRMHQIRVHLQYLGHPIVNDSLYNDVVFGKDKAKGGLTEKSKEQLIEDLMKQHTIENWLKPMSPEEIAERRKQWGQPKASTEEDPNSEDPFRGFPASLENYVDDEFKRSSRGYDQTKMQFVDFCNECNSSYTDPAPEELLIYLHCYRYSGDGWEYKASWPNWAREDWTLD